MTPKFPIKLKDIHTNGGACPYQIEATTEEGHYFYLRYRGGRLRAGVAESRNDFWTGDNKWSYNVIDIVHGNSLDGWAHHDEIAPLLEGKVVLPLGEFYESFPEEVNKFPRSAILP